MSFKPADQEITSKHKQPRSQFHEQASPATSFHLSPSLFVNFKAGKFLQFHILLVRTTGNPQGKGV